MSRAVLFIPLSVLALAGCDVFSGLGSGFHSGPVAPGVEVPAGGSALQTQIACRDRVNQIYTQRDRTEIYRPASTVNTPFSSDYQPGITSRGLADQYEYERTRSDCERNTGSGPNEADVTRPPGR
jgi:hypothetical protein